MTDIGSNHFLDKLEKLPNEEVVWEGGSSYRGVAMQFIYSFVAILVVAGILSLFISLPDMLMIENPDYIAQPERPGSSEQNKAAPTQKKPVNKQPRQIINNALIGKIIVFGIPAFLILIVWMMWLRIKNSWFVVTTERICIQQGIFTRQTMAIDIDKVVSVISTHTLLDRLFKVHSLEIVHAGVLPLRAQQGLIFSNPYKMPYVLSSTRLASQLLNNWLPRDNKHKG